MRLAEITVGPLMEMSYRKKKAEAIITGLERPINDHLLKLIAVESGDPKHWRGEVSNWLGEVAEIRLKPDDKPAPAGFYFDILFDEPFGGVEVPNVGARLRRLSRQGYTLRSGLDVSEVVEALRNFHRSFADRCATGYLTDEGVITLVDALPAPSLPPVPQPPE